MSEEYGERGRKKGRSREDFEKAAKDAAKDLADQRGYKADLYVITSGTGNPIHEYIVILTPADIPDVP